jgi:hypothetical protein
MLLVDNAGIVPCSSSQTISAIRIQRDDRISSACLIHACRIFGGGGQKLTGNREQKDRKY